MPRSARPQLEHRFSGSLRSFGVTPGTSLGVAVSGGADSVALLRLLLSIRQKFGLTLQVVHFHHSLRGHEADADAEFVAQLARAHGLAFLFEKQDVAAAARQNRWNIEDSARRLRYAFFEAAVSSGRLFRVAVAHTADDQAETVVAHLLRGTGLCGLAGIHPVAGGVIRPLLTFRRAELRAYLESIGQTWREDRSNLDTNRTRARIRARVLPVFEQEFSPRAVEHLANFARLAREEAAFWDASVEAVVRQSVRSSRGGYTVRAEDLLAPPLFSAIAEQSSEAGASISAALRPLTERLVRRLYEKVRVERSSLNASQVERVIALASGPSSGRVLQLPGGVEVERSFADIHFRGSSSAHAGKGEHASASLSGTALYRYAIALPGRGETFVSVPEIGTGFRLKVIDWPLRERETNSGGVALDADLLRTSLVLRNWRPGDAYRPRGRREPKKLKRLFLVRRVPLWQRAGWPVLESAGRVVWARGFPPAAEFSANQETRAGLLIEESAADK